MSDSLVAQPVVDPTPMALNVRKLTRAQMAELLTTCFHEQRAPKLNELTIPTPMKSRITYTTERTGTGLFDSLDDDTLTKVLVRLPIKMRIVFAKSLCKQFAAAAQGHKVFKALYVSPCGGPFGETKEATNNMLRTVGNWRFLTMGSRSISPLLRMSVDSQIEELTLHGGCGRTIDMPPANHLQGLAKLKTSSVSAPTVKLMRTSIDASKLKELNISCVKGTNETVALLKASSNLERLSLTGLPYFDMSPIIDVWRKLHGGFPPLRFLHIGTLGYHVTMHNLEKLDLDELYCYGVSESVTKGRLPSMRALHVHGFAFNATERLPRLKTLVESCPGLRILNLMTSYRSTPDTTAVAEVMKTEFPHIDVEVCVH
jgi:hypothetical protein